VGLRVPNSLCFDVSTARARELQLELASHVVRRNQFEKISTIAGADISLSDRVGYAAVIVYSFPKLQEIERASAVGNLNFPYVPGLLSFREIPLLREAFAKLKRQPDLIIVDGQGIAHPRRIGIASHLGLALDIPTIGSAKSLLVGEYQRPHQERGSTSPLMDGSDRIGTVLRTRAGVSPLFISIGHRVDLRTAVKYVLKCSDGFRLPKPQRLADQWTKQLRRAT
jgi:deoxyribonuclease V